MVLDNVVVHKGSLKYVFNACSTNPESAVVFFEVSEGRVEDAMILAATPMWPFTNELV